MVKSSHGMGEILRAARPDPTRMNFFWIHLVQRLMVSNLSGDDDSFRWKLINSGSFTIKSKYADDINTGTVLRDQYI